MILMFIFQLAEAVDYYRDVLSIIREHEKHLRVDNLQLLHCYHNLHETLQLSPEGTSYSLEDDKLQQKVNDDKHLVISLDQIIQSISLVLIKENSTIAVHK